MKIEKIYIVGVHRYAFKAGEAGKVFGTYMCTPEGLEPRPAFEVHYEDGKIDFVSLKDVEDGNYQLISEAEFKAGNIPEVKY